MGPVSHEFIEAASVFTPQTFIPTLIGGTTLITGAAKSIAIVHQSEKAVILRKGAPMLKKEITQKIMAEIATELPDFRIQSLLDQGVIGHEEDLSILPSLNDDELLSNGPAKGATILPVYNLPKSDIKTKRELRDRMNEKIEELPEHIRKVGIYRIRGRGVVLLRPFIDSVVKINVANQTTKSEEFELDCIDGPQVKIKPTFTWQVRPDADNPYKALFEINNDKETKVKEKTHELEQTVDAICSDGLTRVLRNREYEQVRNYVREEITVCAQEACGKDLLKFGVHLSEVWFRFPSLTPPEKLGRSIQGAPDPDKAAIVAATAAVMEGSNVVPIRGDDAA